MKPFGVLYAPFATREYTEQWLFPIHEIVRTVKDIENQFSFTALFTAEDTGLAVRQPGALVVASQRIFDWLETYL